MRTPAGQDATGPVEPSGRQPDGWQAPEVRASRLLECSAEGAWAAVTDVRRHAAWIPLTRIDAPAHLGVGGRFTGVSGPGATRGLPGLADTMVVERLDPPGPGTGVAVFRKLGPVLLGSAEVHVQPLAPGVCRLTWIERVHLRGPQAAARWWRPASARLAGLALRPMLHLALRRIATELDA